ncbi:MarR family winged helix-turn-helix transcriptional regulator [Cryptosporangium phraense]|uniref:MarR family transcriptional regulator n=1 Tax=Cryptosporangium phraense TaxID=2593070 RepID=A0A545AHH3_9ACTN|nr:MarR family transcriptional regulator [Cryptosporangium phraense]TQS40767.1 MarR family transcriptional regulator [Cryptosporangium phraense]
MTDTQETAATREAAATRETHWLSPDEQRTWRAYIEANRLLNEALDRQLQRDAGMPHTYYEILVRLADVPGHSLRMSELAHSSLSSRSRLSHAVSRLEERGWVRRESCPTDGRGALAVLTDEGYRVLREAAPAHVAEVRKRLMDRLTPEQVAQLGEIARAICGESAEAAR